MPFPRTDLACDLSNRYAKSGVAVENGNADLNFRDLPVEVPRHEALPQQLHTMHLGFDTASSVISTPPLPNGAAEMSRCIDGLVAGYGTGAGGLPRLGILARRDDSMGITGSNHVMASACVISPVGGH